ncbi:DUF7108 family protein [Halobacterium zhouii]|uniref:DUF7108 family protein n=1 Tax=Halobacterium zhouii TaxID=2902624 RepID=UPI001E4FB087|nr:rnhA operon protein [Halobacterium zhouii]
MTDPVEDLPGDVTEEAERLTRLARDAADDDEAAAYRNRRDELLAEYGFVARVREDDTLVCYPEDWLDEEELVRVDDVENTDRAAEVSLAGRGEQGDYESAAEHNADLADQVRERHGGVHGANAAAFADFMSNHYARPMESATDTERAEFVSEYYPRNAWPSEEQREAVERSLELIDETADRQD